MVNSELPVFDDLRRWNGVDPPSPGLPPPPGFPPSQGLPPSQCLRTGWWTGEIYIALPSCGGQGILLEYSRIESLSPTRNLNLFHEPSPHPDPLPSHRMGAEREQEADTSCSTEDGRVDGMVDGMVDGALRRPGVAARRPYL